MVDADISQPILSRKAAKEQGSKYYFTGAPCKNGHTTLRRTSAAACIECQRAAIRDWRRQNRDRARASDRKYHAKHIEKRREKDKKWYRENREYKISYRKNWYQTNHSAALEISAKSRTKRMSTEEGRSKVRAQSAAWNSAHPEKARASIDNWWAKNPGNLAMAVNIPPQTLPISSSNSAENARFAKSR